MNMKKKITTATLAAAAAAALGLAGCGSAPPGHPAAAPSSAAAAPSPSQAATRAELTRMWNEITGACSQFVGGHPAEMPAAVRNTSLAAIWPGQEWVDKTLSEMHPADVQSPLTYNAMIILAVGTAQARQMLTDKANEFPNLKDDYFTKGEKGEVIDYYLTPVAAEATALINDGTLGATPAGDGPARFRAMLNFVRTMDISAKHCIGIEASL